jgi:hypothetical protein
MGAKEKSKSVWNYSDIRESSCLNDSEPQMKRPKRRTYLKTEAFKEREEKQQVRREVKLPNLARQRLACGNFLVRKSALMQSLKKVKLHGADSGQFSGDSCKIGKEIVILNGYKDY